MAIHNKKKEQGVLMPAWAPIQAMAGIMHQPFLALDMRHRVILANDAFSKTFQMDREAIVGEVIYMLGDGEWDIPALRRLLEEIIPRNSFFREYEIDHEFSLIGPRNLLCSACMVPRDAGERLIFLAIEDMTALMSVAETIALQMRALVAKNAAQIRMLEMQVAKLERELDVQKGK